jgi:ABC-type sulfate transport system permease component
MTPRTLFAVALAYLGVSYVCGGATMVLALVTGPFASTIVGIILLYVASRIYRGDGTEK